MKKIDRYILGMVQVNTYVLWNDGHVLIIDPGSVNKKLIQDIKDNNGIVDGIILTHGHFDHIAGVDGLVHEFNCPVYINSNDMALLTDPYLNFSYGQDVIVKTKANDLLPQQMVVGNFLFNVIDAPGHSEGCSMILWDNHLFCGDVVFQGSIGRTDLATSSNTKMMQSLRMMKETLSPELLIHPGHGPSTTWKDELQYNPFLQF